MSTAAVVLAAGKGTRFRSELAKVLHPVAGRTMLGWVLGALAPLELDRVVVVVGHQADDVRAEAERAGVSDLVTVVQAEQRGTGHAVRIVAEAGAVDDIDTVLVLPGDVPLLASEPLAELLADHASAPERAATLLTIEPEDPTGYGRVVRDDSGRVRRIVEHRDADEGVRAIRESNAGIYAFARAHLVRELAALTTDNDQGEEYLTDVIAPLVDHGVGAVVGPIEVAAGVNDRWQLAELAPVLRQRILADHARAGVTIVDPATTYVGADVQIATDAVIHPGTHLEGRTRIGPRAQIGPDSRLVDAEVEEDATVTYSVVLGASVGPAATVGPFSYLRPAARLERGAKAGAFVEIKKSVVGEGSKVPHLSYIGDATIGKDVNIGAATVTVNYDGRGKHPTVIGDRTFIGSDTMLVAPVTIGSDAYTGAGSVITSDVPDGALAVERTQQRTIEGYTERKRARDR